MPTGEVHEIAFPCRKHMTCQQWVVIHAIRLFTQHEFKERTMRKGNQPRMRAMPSGTPIKELVFSFQGAGNLPDSTVGHENKLVIRFDDSDHITERWTWRKQGKDTDIIYHLVRMHPRPK